MKILRNISLRSYNTFGLDYRADSLVLLETEEDAVSFFRNRESYTGPLLIMGEGSNILFTADFKGTILIPGIKGIKVENQENDFVFVSAGSGIKWDSFVEWCVNNGYGGVENLSLIPGTVGAAPVQNIGAYGVEVKDTIVKVRTIGAADGKTMEFSNKDCRFGYRNSVFKECAKGKYLVIKVLFKLRTKPLLNLTYDFLKDELKRIGEPTLMNVRQTVIKIRRSRLPDPAAIGNAGSFFKNPTVKTRIVEDLKMKYPQVPSWDDPSGGIKLSAGWLIDQCGWKGIRIGDAGVHDKQALVLVNHGNATGKEIHDLSEKIRKSVLAEFGIELEREVEIIGAI